IAVCSHEQTLARMSWQGNRQNVLPTSWLYGVDCHSAGVSRLSVSTSGSLRLNKAQPTTMRGQQQPEEVGQRVRLSKEELFMSVSHRVVVRQ
ncbi:hypothetical protein ACFQ1S_43600, partial [Kibdelosporangium lantanae]